jgi:hypothetical protein
VEVEDADHGHKLKQENEDLVDEPVDLHVAYQFFAVQVVRLGLHVVEHTPASPCQVSQYEHQVDVLHPFFLDAHGLTKVLAQGLPEVDVEQDHKENHGKLNAEGP